MRSLLIFFVLLPALLFSTTADFDFSGSLTNTLKYRSINTDSIFNQGNLLALPNFSYIMGFYVNGKGKIAKSPFNYGFRLRGQKNFNEQLDFYKDGQLYQNIHDYFAIDEFYLNYTVNSSIYFLAGKQRFSWGNGMIYNPIDVINPFRYPFFPNRDEEGAWVLKAEIIPVRFFNFSICYNPEIFNFNGKFKYSSSNVALRANFLVSSFEFSLYYLQKLKNLKENVGPRLGLTSNFTFPFGLNLYLDMIYENESEYQYISENFVNYNKNGQDLYSVLFGVSYISQGQLDFSVILEYYYNGKGCSNLERKSYFKKLDILYDDLAKQEFQGIMSGLPNRSTSSLFNSDGKMLEVLNTIGLYNYYYLNRHYIGAKIQVSKIKDRFDLGLVFLWALSDSSFLINPKLDWNLADSITTSFYANVAGGSNNYSQYKNHIFKSELGMNLIFHF